MDTHDGSSPDSWEQDSGGGGGGDAGIEDQLKTGLNINATPFVPSSSSNNHDSLPKKPASFSGGLSASAKNAVGNSANSSTKTSPDPEEPMDEWEKDANNYVDSSRTTSDCEEDEFEEGTENEKAKKPRRKKKPSVHLQESKKEHVNVVFIGHVDAGKSTIGGHIMFLTGMVDKRTLEKYEREAKEKNRESWYLSWALDTNQEERDKGKTVEVGRAFFETDTKHFTILDAPGHKSFVPNMIGGASQADLAVLVISARKGEFETGFDRGGQTREHAMLVKTAGVKHLVVLVNKMDDSTVNWSEERYIHCRDNLIPYLKKCGFNPKTDVFFMPVSGMTGAFLKDPPSEEQCPWYRGPCFIEYIEGLPVMDRMSDGPVRMPIVDRYKDMGTIVLGKLESGALTKQGPYVLMPNRTNVEIIQIWSDDFEVDAASSGENVKVKLKGIEEEDVSSGFVLCPTLEVCNVGRIFDAQVVILEHKSIICAGYGAVLHIHTLVEECTIRTLICSVDKKTGKKTKGLRFIKQDQIAIVRLETPGLVCLETFKNFPQMGRFTLRDEGRTIAIGKVLKVVE